MGEVLGHQISEIAAVRLRQEMQTEVMISSLKIGCDAQAVKRLVRYHELLTDWNTRMNLTGDTDFETSLERLYADSLAPLRYAQLFQTGAKLIDVGSGAGFPGLPLAIARPDLHVTLLDSLMKRIQFLSAVVEALELPNVRLKHARAEDGGRDPQLRERFDIAVARAVAPFPVLCELLLPFVRIGGRMLCYKGPSAAEELESGQRAAQMVGGGEVATLPVSIPTRPEWQHCLLLCEKMQKTPKQYPRKAGTPGREPLGGSIKVGK